MEDTLERWWRLGSWQGERLWDAASPRRSPPSDAATAVPLPSGGGPWVPGAADPPRRRGHPHGLPSAPRAGSLCLRHHGSADRVECAGKRFLFFNFLETFVWNSYYFFLNIG